jgi:exodeoxyribonuclease III
MLLATWNVNSIRARDARLREWLAARKPDVVCLQELKCASEQLPEWLREDGWHVASVGQKTYNGVAILSRTGLSHVSAGLGDGQDGEGVEPARLIAATVQGVRVISAYFPNGGTLGSDKYQYKLRWMQRLRAWLDRWCAPDQALALCGDFNVAPEPRDVYDPAKWESTVLFSPEVRAGLEQVRAFGLTDAFRLQQQGTAYSWWDYRAGAFRKDQGLRIDHVYVTAPLAARCTAAEIDREARAGDGASDHAPVLVTFKD